MYCEAEEVVLGKVEMRNYRVEDVFCDGVAAAVHLHLLTVQEAHEH